MSWHERPYTDDDSANSYGSHGGGRPHGVGLRSWFGGLPAPGKAVKALLIANIGMFILCQFTGGGDGAIFKSLAMYVQDAVYRFQIWRLVTFSYLHDQREIFHLLFNMIGLYFLGVMLEARWGALKFFLFYTAGSLVGVFLYVVLSLLGWLRMDYLGIPISLVGASGSVLALMGACAAMFPAVRIILVFFPVPIRLACVIFVVLYTWNLVNRGPNAGGDACHLAGLAFGVYFGYRGERWFRALDGWRSGRERRQWEARRKEAHDLERRVDDILEKVRREGIQSLSRGEKRILEEATRARQSAGRRD